MGLISKPLLSILISFSLLVCSFQTAASQSENPPVTQPQNNLNPLTGLPVERPELLNRRPVLVKISNYPPSVRPQSGLTFADIVFEYYIGEGMNRFLGLFYGNDAVQAGSLRSGRLVDAQLTPMYQGILVYGSADPRVDEVIENKLGDRAISHLEAGCPVICGAKDTHLAPWVYADTAAITRFAANHGVALQKPVLRGMVFDSTPHPSDEFAIKIGVTYARFDRGEWRYDPQTSKYNRWQEKDLNRETMEPLTDQINGQQVAFSNIIVIFTEYIEHNPTLHQIHIWENTDGQPALFFRDGMKYDGFWRSHQHNQPLQFYNEDGLPFDLKPGNTWVIIAGNSSETKQTNMGEWEIDFNIP